MLLILLFSFNFFRSSLRYCAVECILKEERMLNWHSSTTIITILYSCQFKVIQKSRNFKSRFSQSSRSCQTNNLKILFNTVWSYNLKPGIFQSLNNNFNKSLFCQWTILKITKSTSWCQKFPFMHSTARSNDFWYASVVQNITCMKY